MLRRPVRIAVVVVGLLLTVGIGYRVFQDEQDLSHARTDAAGAETTARQTAEALLDIRASLHAYVAPGQGLPFWAKRAQAGVDTVRQSLMALDAAVTPFGGSLAESLDGVDQLAATEQRVRTYVTQNEPQLAGDVIFSEVRDLLAAATNQVQAARIDLAKQYERRTAAIREEQLMLAAVAFGAWIAIALWLVPVEPATAATDPAEWRDKLADALKKPVPVTEVAVTPPATPVAPAVPVEPSIAVSRVRAVSEICSDLSALADPGALEGALARANTVLDATGLIVWVASNDGSSLSPVATHGFDPKLVARIGRVSRDSANLTAAAFRDNMPRVSAATEMIPGALAVTMCSPSGPVGVLSVEMKPGQQADDAKLALAGILAAQLATLAVPVAAPQAALVDLAAEAVQPRRAAL